jgi:hypothetical protein
VALLGDVWDFEQGFFEISQGFVDPRYLLAQIELGPVGVGHASPAALLLVEPPLQHHRDVWERRGARRDPVKRHVPNRVADYRLDVELAWVSPGTPVIWPLE